MFLIGHVHIRLDIEENIPRFDSLETALYNYFEFGTYFLHDNSYHLVLNRPFPLLPNLLIFDLF